VSILLVALLLLFELLLLLGPVVVSAVASSLLFLAFKLWCGVLLFPAVSHVSTIVRVLSVVDIPAVAGVPSVFCTLAIVSVGGREGWGEEGKGGGAEKRVS
jgi:hypothetical protein